MSQGPKNQGKLSLTERRNRVALGIKAGKTNRAIAKELGVDEGTVRRDRKSLPPPVEQASLKTPAAKVRKVRKLPEKPTGPSPSKLRPMKMLEIVNVWIKEQGLTILDDLEYVLDKAEKLLFLGQDSIKNFSTSTKSPAELLGLAKPSYAVEEYMFATMEFCGEWLAQWIACCLPGDFQLQRDFLLKVKLQARSEG